MAQRDLSKSFVSERKRSGSPSRQARPAALPPAWVDTAEGVKRDIALVKGHVTQLAALQQQRLRVVYESAETDQQEDDIKKLALAVAKALRGLEGRIVTIAPTQKEDDVHLEERVVRINAQRSLSNALLDVTRESSRVTADYNERLAAIKGETPAAARRLPPRKEPDAKAAAASSAAAASASARGATKGSGTGLSSSTSSSSESMSLTAAFAAADAERERERERARAGGGGGESGYLLLQDQEQDADQKRAELRHQEIVTLAQSVQDLAQLMNRLNVMVQEQGELLDQIDHHIDSAKKNVGEAVKDLDVARKKDIQNKKQTAVVGTFLVGLIGIFSGILAAKH